MRSKRLKVLRRKQRKATKMAPDRSQGLFEEEKTQKRKYGRNIIPTNIRLGNDLFKMC